MADAKVSALTALTGANVAADDKLYIVDVSATTSGSKAITVAEFEAKALADMAALTALTTVDEADVFPVIDDPAGTPLGKKVTLANLRTSMTPKDVYIATSGDATGATDTAAIQAALVKDQGVRLGPGTYYINASLTVTSTGATPNNNVRIEGAGLSTLLTTTANTFPLFLCTAAASSPIQLDLQLSNLTLYGGTYGIELDSNSSYVFCTGVRFREQTSHGVYLHDGGWILSFIECEFLNCGGDGINAVSDASNQNGNNLSLQNCRFVSCTGHGIQWAAYSLNVSGCLFELNADSGIYIGSATRGAFGVNITGSYFEINGTACIELVGATSYVVKGVRIAGNYMVQTAAAPSSGAPCILVSGDYDTVRNVVIEKDNDMTSSGTYAVQANYALRYSEIWESDVEAKYTFTKSQNNFYRQKDESQVRTFYQKVSCAAGGTAQTTNLIALPHNCILHSVVCHAEIAMNGSGTKTFEVGIGGNTDKYIDPGDWAPGTLDAFAASDGGTNNDQRTAEFLSAASTQLIATWTNEGGTPTAGVVGVYVTYTETLFIT